VPLVSIVLVGFVKLVLAQQVQGDALLIIQSKPVMHNVLDGRIISPVNLYNIVQKVIVVLVVVHRERSAVTVRISKHAIQIVVRGVFQHLVRRTNIVQEAFVEPVLVVQEQDVVIMEL